MLKALIGQKSNTMQAFWIGMGSLSSFALSIVSAAILSRYFDKTEYGTYKQILYVYNTLLLIFTAGLPSVFSYFLPRFTLNQGKDIVWKISKILFFTGCLFSAFLFLFSNPIASLLNNPELAIGLRYFSPIPMLLLPTLGIEGIFSTYKKSIYIAIYDASTRFLMLLFIVLPVILLKGSYLYAIYGWIVVSIISFFIAFYFKGIPFKGIKSEKSNLSLREVFAFSLPLVAASIAGIALRSADQFYISRFFGPSVFAEFSNGFIQIPFVAMVTSAAATILTPMFSKMIFEESDINKILTLWKSALLKSAIIIYPIVVFFLFNSREIVVALYSDLYIESDIYFQISMILNFFNIIIFAPLILSMGKTFFYFKVHAILALSAWTFGYVVVLVFNSPISVAILSVLISIIKIFIFIFFVAGIFKINPIKMFPVNKIIVVISHSFIVMIVVYIGSKYFMTDFNVFWVLTINFLGFYGLLLLTANWVKVDYLMMINSVLERKSKY